jgi:hypothetical protein
MKSEKLMRMRLLGMVVLLGALGSVAKADDKWEISGVGGASFYLDLKASGGTPLRSAKFGFFDGIAVGAVLSQTGGGHWGGEFHYLFQTNNMRLRAAEGATGRADFGAQSHALHYDALLYATRKEARIRPFVAAGPGFKFYQTSGQERAFQPLNNIVVLSRENSVKFLVAAGGGIKVRLGAAQVRLDVRDYVTGIPKNFTAFPGVKLSGQFHNFVATGGIGIVF